MTSFVVSLLVALALIGSYHFTRYSHGRLQCGPAAAWPCCVRAARSEHELRWQRKGVLAERKSISSLPTVALTSGARQWSMQTTVSKKLMRPTFSFVDGIQFENCGTVDENGMACF